MNISKMKSKIEAMKSKRGQVGFDVAKTVMISLLTLGVIAFALIIAMNSLGASSVSTNQTTAVLNNISVGTATFFSNAGTWFSLLAVVVIILIISLVIVAVNRFNDKEAGGL